MHACGRFTGKPQSSKAHSGCQGRASNALCHNWVGVVITFLCAILPPTHTLVSAYLGVLTRLLMGNWQAPGLGQGWSEWQGWTHCISHRFYLWDTIMRHDRVTAHCMLPHYSSLLIKANVGWVWERPEAPQQTCGCVWKTGVLHWATEKHILIDGATAFKNGLGWYLNPHPT